MTPEENKDDIVYIGIDFSINSPAVCYWSRERGWSFSAFVNNKDGEYRKGGMTRKVYKHYKRLEILSADHDDITFTIYEGGYHDKDFIRENQRMIDAARTLATAVMREIFKATVRPDGTFRPAVIGLEGASFMSKERNSTDLNMFNGILRAMIASSLGSGVLYVFPPAAIKKKAGKGNLNKDGMITAFINMDGLEECTVYQYICKAYEEDRSNIKPLDDLSDAFWITETLKSHFNIEE